MRGTGQHLRGIVLPHHVREVDAAHRHSHSRENIVLQSRAVGLAHGRQLRCVAHHNEAAAVVSAVNEAQQVVEQLPRAEHGFGETAFARGNHRSLVHNKERVFQTIETERKARVFTLKSILTVNKAMDSVGRMPGIKRKHLGGPARRCKQHDGALQLLQNAHQGRHQRSLARAGVAAQNDEGVGTGRELEA